MQFVLVDIGATLVFILGYRTVVALQRRHAVPGVSTRQSRREWPRLSHPR